MRRSSSNFCSAHSRLEETAVNNSFGASTKVVKKKSKTIDVVVRSGLWCSVKLDVTSSTFRAIDRFSQWMIQELIRLGMPIDTCVRQLYKLEEEETNRVLGDLLELVEEAKQLSTSFHCKDPRVQSPGMVMAPPVSGRSSSWAKGQIHRDFDDTTVSGVYSFLLCLTDVDASNGAIELWPGSTKIPHDPQFPMRYINRYKLESKILTGQKGTLWIWDARILHRSLPNQTSKRRNTLMWFVNSLSMRPIKIYR